MIGAEMKRAIELAVAHNIPFAAYAYPSEGGVTFICQPASAKPQSSLTFTIGTFCGEPFDEVAIHDCIDAHGLIALAESGRLLTEETSVVTVGDKSTDYETYRQAIEAVVDDLKTTGGKTVISRLICEESAVEPWDAADCYFEAHPGCFRFIYYTPQTGLWLGATPETLLKHDAATERFDTMSLAGTRRAGEGGAWDNKNIEEHEYVTRYICSTLESLGLTTEVEEFSEVHFGTVEHLCNRIHATGALGAREVAKRLSPTPAVCGMPKEDALAHIARYESHHRNCYGGWVAVERERDFQAYVNLRSTQVEKSVEGYIYHIIAGGGITKDSHPESEWAEADAKASSLRSIVTQQKQTAK